MENLVFVDSINDPSKFNALEKTIKKYLDTKMITLKNKTGILIADTNKTNMYIQDGENETWKIAEPEDLRNFERAGLIKEALEENPNNFNKIIGFIDMFRNGKEMVYRVKDLSQMQNNVGTRISGQTPGKRVLIGYLNNIVGKELYSLEQSKEIMQLGVCVIIELLLRDYNATKKDQKVWFLNPEKALYNKIAKYRIDKK